MGRQIPRSQAIGRHRSPKTLKTITCPSCDGAGKDLETKEVCPDCRGKGKLENVTVREVGQ